MAWHTAGTGDGICDFKREQEWVLKTDYDRVERMAKRQNTYNQELLEQNRLLRENTEELETHIQSLQADLFLKTIMNNMPTLETLKKYSDENDRLIAENNRLTALISGITQLLYGGNDDDDVCE